MDEWIERARDGDREALGALWRAHQHLLLRYFRGRGSTQAEDLASQVWIDVATSLHRFRGDGDDFRRWLFTIARRRQIDATRRHSRRPEDLDGQAGHDAVDDAGTSAFDSSGALERAVALVRRLPPDMAEAVLLRVVADLSVDEVAQIMGRREGHVRVLVHRGLRKLADELAVTDEGSPTIKPV
ncbi:MAG: RNA polymerase sigma factor [Ilumatobacteraceae bacterium]